MGRYLAYFSALLVILPLTIGIINHRSHSKHTKPIYYLLFISFALDLLCIILAEISITNIAVVNIFMVIEFSFIIYLYKKFFERFINLPFPVLILPFVIIAAISFFYNGIGTFSSLALSIETFVFIFCSLSAFYLIFRDLLYSSLFNEPFFWINTAVLIYFAGDLFFFGFLSFLQKYNLKTLALIYPIHSIMHIFYYILISTGLWKVRKA